MFIILGHWHCLLHVRALLAKRNRGKSEIRQVHSRSPLDSQLLHQEFATPRAPLREERNTTSPVSSRRSAKKKYFQGIHDRFVRDEQFRKNMIEMARTEEICRQMNDLADEDHTHHITPEEIDDYRSNWWIRSNKIGSDTMPIRHRSDFKQALSTLRQLKDKEDEAQHNQRWTQSYSSSWWN